MHEYVINVNGKNKITTKQELNYAEVVNMAFKRSKNLSKYYIFDVTYGSGGADHTAMNLTANEKVRIKNGLKFKVRPRHIQEQGLFWQICDAMRFSDNRVVRGLGISIIWGGTFAVFAVFIVGLIFFMVTFISEPWEMIKPFINIIMGFVFFFITLGVVGYFLFRNK